MNDPAFFGYGSLVNLATHDYADPRPARLSGWRRVWKTTDLRDMAFLSVEPAQGLLHGVVARVPGADWAALDEREAAYRRHDVTDVVQHDGSKAQTAIYQVMQEHHAEGTHPILLSYLDVVVQGYLQIYGVEGVADFFATTAGWHVGVRDDRSAPIYPRHQILTNDEMALVDKHLAVVIK